MTFVSGFQLFCYVFRKTKQKNGEKSKPVQFHSNEYRQPATQLR